jgi:hypothetical protein
MAELYRAGSPATRGIPPHGRSARPAGPGGLDPVQAAGPGQQAAEKAPPNALAIKKETLAPLDAGERETLRMLQGRVG